MKRTAILVIAAQNHPVYVHYLHTYWTELINFTNKHTPNIDVFLLFQKNEDLTSLPAPRQNIIIDENTDFNGFFEENKGHLAIPGILSKTIYAFEALQHEYDVFFRTNLSSMIHLPNFEHFIQTKARIIYSGSATWDDALRRDLVIKGKIGPDKRIKMIEELDSYPGNTFISGAAFFINKMEVQDLISVKHKIRYDLVDDVSIGLMMREHEYLPRFSIKISKQEPLDAMLAKIAKQDYCHIRLEHFPVETAGQLWGKLSNHQFLIKS